MKPVEDFRDFYTDAYLELRPGPVQLELSVEHDGFLHQSGHLSGVQVRTRLRVVYRPTDRVLNWTVFEKFIDSLKSEPLSVERAAALIHSYVDELLAPSYLRVELERVDSPGNVVFTVVAG